VQCFLNIACMCSKSRSGNQFEDLQQCANHCLQAFPVGSDSTHDVVNQGHSEDISIFSDWNMYLL
jgi:deoxyxylulose-5-phosphate synthase